MPLSRRPRPGPQRRGLWIFSHRGLWLRLARQDRHAPWVVRKIVSEGLWGAETSEELNRGRMFVPKKPNRAAAGGSATHAAKVCQAFQKLPLLADHLVCLSYEDEEGERSPGVLIVRPSGGAWHLTLKDPSARMQLRVSAETYSASLIALEALLGQQQPPWEVDGWAEQNAAKKRKKGA